ncbi:MAG: hypothetical protein KGK30_03685, partial [Elusimicrobia bacterium]|nr:hypothetical protein [Elusimicrobiota bacterium]
MGARAWVVALSLLLPSVSFCADPPPAPAASDKPFHVSFFGEGGGDLKTPVGGAADYLENSRGGGQKARPAKPAKPAAGQTAPPPQAAAAPAVRKVPAGASPMLARAVPKA